MIAQMQNKRNNILNFSSTRWQLDLEKYLSITFGNSPLIHQVLPVKKPASGVSLCVHCAESPGSVISETLFSTQCIIHTIGQVF